MTWFARENLMIHTWHAIEIRDLVYTYMELWGRRKSTRKRSLRKRKKMVRKEATPFESSVFMTTTMLHSFIEEIGWRSGVEWEEEEVEENELYREIYWEDREWWGESASSWPLLRHSLALCLCSFELSMLWLGKNVLGRMSEPKEDRTALVYN